MKVWNGRNSRQQVLVLDHGLPLKTLKVKLLVCGVLIHDEQVTAQLGDDEAQVKLNTVHAYCTLHVKTSQAITRSKSLN